MFRSALVLSLLLAAARPIQAQVPFRDSLFGTLRTSNIVYGTGLINGGANSFDLMLDIYQPTNIGTPVPPKAPGIVMIHGGSFTTGTRNDLAGLATVYSSYGYTVASISYRLSGQTPPGGAVAAAAQDSRKAMQWMHDNAATYGFDPDRLGVGGISAGAITSLFEAYNNPSPDIRPKAVLDFLGSMLGLESTYIQPGGPPAFVVHGTADTTVPFSSAVAVVNRMNAVGVYNEFYIQQGLGHTIDFSLDFGGRTLFQRNIDFLATFLVPEPSSIALAAFGAAALVAFGRKRVRSRIRRAS